MTKKEKQMEEVIEAMPKTFETKEGGDYVYGDESTPRFRPHAVGTRYLSPEQHAAWIEKCLKDWLRENKGVRVHEQNCGNWRLDINGMPYRYYDTEWDALYAAWKDSQSELTT